jgi:hypothetical protein
MDWSHIIDIIIGGIAGSVAIAGAIWKVGHSFHDTLKNTFSQSKIEEYITNALDKLSKDRKIHDDYIKEKVDLLDQRTQFIKDNVSGNSVKLDRIELQKSGNMRQL